MRTHINTHTIALWLAACAISFAIAASIHLDASLPSPSLQAAQDQQQREQRREQAAAAICLQARGPSSHAIWTQDGHLECTQNPHKPIAANAFIAQAAIK